MKIKEIADALDGRVVGDGSLEIRRPVDPRNVGDEHDLAVAIEKSSYRAMLDSNAKSALVAEGANVPDGKLLACVIASRPRTALAELAVLFEPPASHFDGVHANAFVAPDAGIGGNVSIGPHSTVGPGAEIGENTIIMANVSIGASARVGKDCRFHPGVRIGDRVKIGDRVIVHPNACIGPDGFSFTTAKRNSLEEAKLTGRITDVDNNWIRVGSLGTVIIGDDVEIGAGTTIDRGTLIDTIVRRGTKIDNQVMIGHNVEIGEDCLLCAHVGIAGSVVLGDRIVLGGKVGIADNLKVGSNVVVAASSGIHADVPPNSMMYGTPALPMTKAIRQWQQTRNLTTLYEDVRALKSKLLGKQNDDGDSGESGQ